MKRFFVIFALSATVPSALAGQEAAHCHALTFSDLVGNPITGDVRGTEINLTTGQNGCIVLVKVAEGRFQPTKVGTPVLVGDSLSFRLSDGTSFTGVIVRDTLRGQFDNAGGKAVALRRTAGAVHVHEH